VGGWLEELKLTQALQFSFGLGLFKRKAKKRKRRRKKEKKEEKNAPAMRGQCVMELIQLFANC
jgi:hypothetical protein